MTTAWMRSSVTWGQQEATVMWRQWHDNNYRQSLVQTHCRGVKKLPGVAQECTYPERSCLIKRWAGAWLSGRRKGMTTGEDHVHCQGRSRTLTVEEQTTEAVDSCTLTVVEQTTKAVNSRTLTGTVDSRTLAVEEQTTEAVDFCTLTVVEQTTKAVDSPTLTIEEQTTEAVDSRTLTVEEQTTKAVDSRMLTVPEQQITKAVDSCTFTVQEQTTVTVDSSTFTVQEQTTVKVDSSTFTVQEQTTVKVDSSTMTAEEQTTETVDSSTLTVEELTTETVDSSTLKVEEQTTETVDYSRGADDKGGRLLVAHKGGRHHVPGIGKCDTSCFSLPALCVRLWVWYPVERSRVLYGEMVRHTKGDYMCMNTVHGRPCETKWTLVITV